MVQQAEAVLRDQHLSAKLIYSGGEDLDVLPHGASKGKGLEFLLSEVCLTFRLLLHLLMPQIAGLQPPDSNLKPCSTQVCKKVSYTA